MYGTVVLKATLALHHGRLATLRPSQPVNWCDTLTPSGALEHADESSPFTGGGAVLVTGFMYAQAATEREPGLARVMIGTDQPVIDKVIASERAGKIPLVWEHALRTVDNPVGTDLPVLVDPRDMTKTIGLGPVAPSWGPRVHLLPAPIGSRDNIMELPERLDPRFFNPAPRDQQCQPFKGTEGILLVNLVPNIPEFRSWLPALSVAARMSIDNVPVAQLMWVLDTLTIDAETAIAQVVWRAVAPVLATARYVNLEVTLSGSFEEPPPEAPAPETQSLPRLPTEPNLPVPEVAPVRVARVLPTGPRQLSFLDNPTHNVMQRAAAGGALEDLDLSSVDLQGLDLSGLSFARSRLDGANLSGTKLIGTNLWGATLVGANLAGAILDGADLEDANLSKALGQKASFARANMLRVNLSGARLDNATLDEADLSDCDAVGVGLMGAKLRRAKLNRAKMEKALLVGADFQDASLDFATLAKSSLDDANFAGASLADAELTQCAADGSNFVNARLARAKLTQSRFAAASMTGADLTSANLDRCDFSKAHLDSALLDHAVAPSAKFIGAKMTGASLKSTNLSGADLTQARLTDVDRSTANLTGAKLTNVIE